MTRGRIALGLGLLLVAVIAVRTGTTRSRQVPVLPASPLALDMDGATARLSEALRVQTVSWADTSNRDSAAFLQLHDLLASEFPGVSATLQREVVGGLSLLYTWPGSDPALKPLVLLAHLDVVPVAESTRSSWTHPPFSGELVDGAIWGRGSLDDKSAALSQLEAIESLIKQGFRPKRTIILAFGHDEEIGGMDGAAELHRLLKSRYGEVELVLDEGMSITDGIVSGVKVPVALIGIAEKGYIDLELSVDGEGGHGSMPPPHTAAGRLARAVTALESRSSDHRLEGAAAEMLLTLGPEMSLPQRVIFSNFWLFRPIVTRIMEGKDSTRATLGTTMAATMLSGGDARNVLPRRATAVVNVRIHPRDSIDGVIKTVTEIIDDPYVRVAPLEGSRAEPSVTSPLDGPAYTAIATAIRQVVPDALVAPALVVGMTDSRHYQDLGGRVYRFAPMRFHQEDLARLHGVNERILLHDYETAIRFYAQLIQNVGG